MTWAEFDLKATLRRGQNDPSIICLLYTSVLTSGGDAPGMNAAIRAVVRTALGKGLRVRGIRKGYQGLLDEDIIDLTARDVSDTIQRGGTFLQTARCSEMRTKEGQQEAAAICKKYEIDGLVVIGGDGSFAGAQKLSHYGINTVGIPGTIDLDKMCIRDRCTYMGIRI